MRRNPARILSLMIGFSWTSSQYSLPDLRSLWRISFEQLLPASVRLGRRSKRAGHNLTIHQDHVFPAVHGGRDVGHVSIPQSGPSIRTELKLNCH
jgi:hypothetical protein